MNRSVHPNSAIATFFRDLPENLQTPAAIAALGSIGAHALFLATLPAFTPAEEQSEDQLRQVQVVQLNPQEQAQLPGVSTVPTPNVGLLPLPNDPNGQLQVPSGSPTSPSPILTEPLPLYQVPGLSPLPPAPAPAPNSLKILQDLLNKSRVATRRPQPTQDPEPPVEQKPEPQQPTSNQPTANQPSPLDRAPFPPQDIKAQDPAAVANSVNNGQPAPQNQPQTQNPTSNPAADAATLERQRQERLALIAATTYNASGTEEDERYKVLAKATEQNSPANQVQVPTIVYQTWLAQQPNIEEALKRNEVQIVEHPSKEQREALKIPTGDVMQLEYKSPFPIQNFRQRRVLAVAKVNRDGTLQEEPTLLTRTGYKFLDEASIRYIKAELEKPELKESLKNLPEATKTVIHRFEFKYPDLSAPRAT